MADGAGEQGVPDVARSARTVVPVGGVGICVQAFGDDADPAVVLVGGAGASMDGWRDGFCAAIARGVSAARK